MHLYKQVQSHVNLKTFVLSASKTCSGFERIIFQDKTRNLCKTLESIFIEANLFLLKQYWYWYLFYKQATGAQKGKEKK